jgi:hypothetical protein
MTDQHDTIVVKDSSSSTGLILGIIAIVTVLALGWYFLMGPGTGSNTSSNDTKHHGRVAEHRSQPVLTPPRG